MTSIKQELKIEPFHAGEVVQISSDSSEEEFGDTSTKWGQGSTISATGSATEQKKKTAEYTATLVREKEEIKNNFLKYLFDNKEKKEVQNRLIA